MTDSRHIDDLHAHLKLTVDTIRAISLFSPDLLTEFKEECSTNSLQINESKTKIVRFNLPNYILFAQLASLRLYRQLQSWELVLAPIAHLVLMFKG